MILSFSFLSYRLYFIYEDELDYTIVLSVRISQGGRLPSRCSERAIQADSCLVALLRTRTVGNKEILSSWDDE